MFVSEVYVDGPSERPLSVVHLPCPSARVQIKEKKGSKGYKIKLVCPLRSYTVTFTVPSPVPSATSVFKD